MSQLCTEFSRIIFDLKSDRLSTAEQLAWQEHLRQCSTCGEQVAMDDALTRALAGVPAPALINDFDAQLFAQLAPSVKAVPRRASAWLYLYWIVAGLASFYIIYKIAWPLVIPDTIWTFVVMLSLVPLSFLVLLHPEKFLARLFRLAAPLLR